MRRISINQPQFTSHAALRPMEFVAPLVEVVRQEKWTRPWRHISFGIVGDSTGEGPQ